MSQQEAVTTSGSDSFISICDVRKYFGASAAEGYLALKGVTLDIAESEFLSILGPSGCGKSTLLQIVAGLMKPSSGEVLFRGKPVKEPPEGMIYVFQQYSKSLFQWRTVGRNVAFPLEHRSDLSKAEIRDRCSQYLRMVGLAGFETRYPWQLSGGMQQRVAIARALAAEPRVLLLDEPFSAVDALTRLELQSLILDIWEKQKLTIILVTHDVDEAIFMADRVALLSARPTVLDNIVPTGLARPRDSITTREEERFIDLRHDLLEILLRRNAKVELHAR